MFNFFDLDIIPTFLSRFKVEKILAIGLSNKLIIDRLITFCINNHSLLCVIDPEININDLIKEKHDSKDVNKFIKENVKHFKDNGLNVLPNLESFDAVFIDDDPNWYTVYNELDLIRKNNSDFPLVFVCNNKYPHKRRDSYINPDNIPEEYKNECCNELPIIFEENNEIKRSMVADGFYHAIYKDTPKNGVLTAIEDFLNQNPSLNILEVNPLEGITLIYNNTGIAYDIRIEKILAEEKRSEYTLSEFSDKFIENNLLLKHVAGINLIKEDFDKIEEYKSEIINQNSQLKDYEDKIQINNAQIEYKTSQINNIKNQVNLKETQLQSAEAKLLNKDNEIKLKDDELASKVLELQNAENKLSKISNDYELIKNKYDELVKLNKKDIEGYKNKLSHIENQLQSAEAKLLNRDNEIKLKDDELASKVLELQNAENKLSEISTNYEMIENKYKELIKLNKEDIEYYKNKLIHIENHFKNKELEFQNEYCELQDKFNTLILNYDRQLGKLNNKEYCISCYKEEINNNKIEMEYIKKNNKFGKKMLTPLAYGYLIFKSKPNEIGTNIKFYKSLKNNECFDIGYYLNKYPDIAKSKWCEYFSPELHYVCEGFNEKRKFNKKFFKDCDKKELIEDIKSK